MTPPDYRASVAARWNFGDMILRREVLGPLTARSVRPTCAEWVGKPWIVAPVLVVEDSDEAMVTFIAPGAQFGVPEGVWPECSVPELPTSLDDTLWFERSERMSSGHSGGPVGATGMSMIGHGSGAQDEDRKDRMSRFLHKVDEAARHYLRSCPNETLVVAGAQTVVALYQKVSRHQHVLSAPIGSPHELSRREIRERVAALVAPVFAHAHDDALGRLGELLGTGLAGTDIEELAEAAATGRIGDLLVASTAPVWVMPPKRSEILHEWQPGATDVINDIICDGWRHGANTHRCAATNSPKGELSPLCIATEHATDLQR